MKPASEHGSSSGDYDHTQMTENFYDVKKRRLTEVSLASIALSQNIPDWSKYEEIHDEDEEEMKDKFQALDDRKSPWFSLWLSNIIQMLCGVQFSIYFMSMWSYLSSLDSTADLTFLGLIIASYSIGQAVASPLFGVWNQRTMSTKMPVAVGLVCSILGNLVYALLPTINSNVKWYMLASRILIGLGSGNYAVLRSYTASASVPRDRNKAIALATGAYVLGISFGPAIQSIFTPIGNIGWQTGKFYLNMFTCPAYVMVICNLVSMILLFTSFKENYAGILTKEERSFESSDSYFVLPKFDYLAAYVCIYLFFVQNSVSTVIETLSAPLTQSMYDWKDADVVLYTGMGQGISCLINVAHYGLIGFTRIGKIDRRILILFGLANFAVYHLIILPWPFWTGKLDYIPHSDNSTVEDTSEIGGCYERYTWCATNPRVPLWAYIVGFVIGLGFAFPYVASPIGTLFSEIIGPRNQGTQQGVMALFGSLARCIAPIVTTYLFEQSGYMWPMILELIIIGIGALLVLVFYVRLTALKITPEMGKKLKYKNGVFYRM